MYLDTGRVPGIWEENGSDVIVQEDSEEDSKKVHSSEDESSVDEDGEKKAFKEKLIAFMKEKGRFAEEVTGLYRWAHRYNPSCPSSR